MVTAVLRGVPGGHPPGLLHGSAGGHLLLGTDRWVAFAAGLARFLGFLGQAFGSFFAAAEKIFQIFP